LRVHISSFDKKTGFFAGVKCFNIELIWLAKFKYITQAKTRSFGIIESDAAHVWVIKIVHKSFFFEVLSSIRHIKLAVKPYPLFARIGECWQKNKA
jgi:hypothetical protein